MQPENDIDVALKGLSRNVVDCKIDLHTGISILSIDWLLMPRYAALNFMH